MASEAVVSLYAKGQGLQRWLAALGVGLVLALAPQASRSEEILTIRVQDRPGSEITLSQTELEALPQVVIDTTTPWTPGVKRFSGPSLQSVLDSLGIDGASVRLEALNDYSADITMEEIGPGHPIIATRIDGEAIPVRGNGPFWIIFPYDSDAKFRTEIVFGQSVWQLSALTVIAR